MSTQRRTVAPGASVHDISRAIPVLVTSSLIEQNPAQAAGALITLLTEGPPDKATLRPTTPEDRFQITRGMLDYGTSSYLKYFVNDLRGREILAQWLSDATPPRKADMEDVSERYAALVGPLLDLLLRLPIQLEHLKDHVGLGKLITGAQKRLRSEAARKKADAVKDKWSALVPSSSAVRAQSPSIPASTATTAKRPASANAATEASTKRVRSTTTAPVSSTTVRPASSLLGTGATTRTRLAAQSERKGSPQLSDTKSTSAARRTTTTTQSSANKDLASFMSLIDQQATPASSVSQGVAPSSATSTATPEPEVRPERKKPKKGVRWKDHDGLPLVAVKMIEPAVYDEDEHGTIATVGQLDMEEGGMFRLAHAEMEEMIDWYTPPALALEPRVAKVADMRGSKSQAKVLQDEYDSETPAVEYADASEIPDSAPAPNNYVTAFASVGSEPHIMTMGPHLRPFAADAVGTSKGAAGPGLPATLATMLDQLAKDTVNRPTPSTNAPPSEPTPDAPLPPHTPLAKYTQSAPMNDMPSSSSAPPIPPMPPWGGPMPMWPFPFPPPDAALHQNAGPVESSRPPPAETGRSRGGNGGGRARRSGRHTRSS